MLIRSAESSILIGCSCSILIGPDPHASFFLQEIIMEVSGGLLSWLLARQIFYHMSYTSSLIAMGFDAQNRMETQ
jgi:hypothetical protein